jgi:biopolymer transport protein ExbD
VELQADGALWIDGVQHEFPRLPQVLDALELARFESGIVAVDPGVPLQQAVDVIDGLSARGLGDVLLREARRFK